MNMDELLGMATEFDAGNPVHLNGVICDEDDETIPFHQHYYVKIRVSKNDGKRGFRSRWWAICQGSLTLNREGNWEYEPRSSERIQTYLEMNRYPSVQAAFEFLNKWKVEELKRAIEQGFPTRQEHLLNLEKADRKLHFFNFWKKQFS